MFDGSQWHPVSGSALLYPHDNWHYVVGTYDGTDIRTWLNGTNEKTRNVGTRTIGSEAYSFGIGSNAANNASEFKGYIDEVRISNISRSSGWINTSFNNQNDTASFMSIGSEELGNVTPSPKGLSHTTGEFWVNHTWLAGSGHITDSYNVSLDGAWNNISASTFRNNTLSAYGDWSNITVYAYNATYGLSWSSAEDVQLLEATVAISNEVVNDTEIYVNESVRLSATVTSADGMDTVKFRVETPYGTLNTTAEKDGDEYFVIYNSTGGTDGNCYTDISGSYYWNLVWANDTTAHTNTTTPNLRFHVLKQPKTYNASSGINNINSTNCNYWSEELSDRVCTVTCNINIYSGALNLSHSTIRMSEGNSINVESGATMNVIDGSTITHDTG